MDKSQITESAKEYVELEADTNVTSIEIIEDFTHFTDECYVLTVQTTEDDISEWWVVAGDTPTNLYPKSQFDNPDYVFSFHQGIMSRMAEQRIKNMEAPPDGEKYDVFICHSSADKEEFVEPLVRELNRDGLLVWYDDDILEIGDSIRESIDSGLAKSHCGAVILSKSFFEKDWTQYELNGLITRDVEGDDTVILPVWYNIDKETVKENSPSLANKKAIIADGQNIQSRAKKLSKAIKSRIRDEHKKDD